MMKLPAFLPTVTPASVTAFGKRALRGLDGVLHVRCGEVEVPLQIEGAR